MNDLELAKKAVLKGIEITEQTVKSVKRKRAIRDSERAFWLGDLDQRIRGFKVALKLIEEAGEMRE